MDLTQNGTPEVTWDGLYVLQQPLVAFSQKENLLPMIIIVHKYHIVQQNVVIHFIEYCRKIKEHHIGLQAIIHILSQAMYS